MIYDIFFSWLEMIDIKFSGCVLKKKKILFGVLFNVSIKNSILKKECFDVSCFLLQPHQ